jgi:hypothetical protein
VSYYLFAKETIPVVSKAIAKGTEIRVINISGASFLITDITDNYFIWLDVVDFSKLIEIRGTI